MSQRIRGVPDGEANASVHVVYDAAEAMLGRVANLLRILAHSPGIAKWFIPPGSGGAATTGRRSLRRPAA